MSKDNNLYKVQSDEKVSLEGKTNSSNDTTVQLGSNNRYTKKTITNNYNGSRGISIIILVVILLSCVLFILFNKTYKITKSNIQLYDIYEQSNLISVIGEDHIIGEKGFLQLHCYKYYSEEIYIDYGTNLSFIKVTKINFTLYGYINNEKNVLFTGEVKEDGKVLFHTDNYYYDFNKLNLEFKIEYSNSTENIFIIEDIKVKDNALG